MSFKPIGSTVTTEIQRSQSAAGRSAGNPTFGGQLTDPNIGTWLADKKPSDMDKAAVLRTSQHNVELEVKYEGRYPTGPNGERLPSYRVAVGCSIEGTTDDRNRALADMQKFMTPASTSEIEGWLAELSVISAKRQESGFSEGLRLTAFASRLSRYPADIARTVVLDYRWKFWPTWAEMGHAADVLVAARNQMMAALMEEEEQEKVNRPPTKEERERTIALVAELFPDVSRRWKERAVNEIMHTDETSDTPKERE